MNPNIYELSKMTKEQYDFIMKRAELDITEQMKVAKKFLTMSRHVVTRQYWNILQSLTMYSLLLIKMKVTPEEIEAALQ